MSTVTNKKYIKELSESLEMEKETRSMRVSSMDEIIKEMEEGINKVRCKYQSAIRGHEIVIAIHDKRVKEMEIRLNQAIDEEFCQTDFDRELIEELRDEELSHQDMMDEENEIRSQYEEEESC